MEQARRPSNRAIAKGSAGVTEVFIPQAFGVLRKDFPDPRVTVVMARDREWLRVLILRRRAAFS